MRKGLWLFSLIVAPVSAFWRTGHLLVSSIAYHNVRPVVQSNLDTMATAMNQVTPSVANFVESSPWMDQIKGDGMHLFEHLHYMGTNDSSCKNDLLFGLQTTYNVLRNPLLKPNSFASSFALRLFTHTIGDLHQPLHIDDRYMGGNTFPLHGKYNNLHALFDAGCGAWFEVQTLPLGDADLTKLYNTSSMLMQKYPFNPSWVKGEWKDWIEEGAILADKIYKDSVPNMSPNMDFITQWQDVMRMQVVKGGYRLAHLLNGAMKSLALQ
jgi:hypothetical protein